MSVRVVAGAKKEAVERLGKERLKISVKEPAKQGLANKRVRELVAVHFKLSVSKVRLISGAHQPAKLFSVDV